MNSRVKTLNLGYYDKGQVYITYVYTYDNKGKMITLEFCEIPVN